MSDQLTIFDEVVYVEIEQLSFLPPKREDEAESFQKWIAARKKLTSIRNELADKLNVCGECPFGITRHDSVLPEECQACSNLAVLNTLGNQLIRATKEERRARRWAKMIVPKKWGAWM